MADRIELRIGRTDHLGAKENCRCSSAASWSKVVVVVAAARWPADVAIADAVGSSSHRSCSA